MGTAPHQNTRGTDQPRKGMFGLLLLLPGLLSAAPATLTKHVKAPSPIYTPPVYNEHTGQGLNHGGYGQGLPHGHGQSGVYGQGLAHGHHGQAAAYGHVTPVKPGHVFTGYPAYSQGHHTGHHAGHQVGHHVSHQVGQYTGSHQHYPASGQYQQLPYPATQYLDSRYPGLGLKTANPSD